MPILKVPIDFLQRIENDPYETARNFLCIPRGTIYPFLPNFDKIKECIDFDRTNPFNEDSMSFDSDFVCKDKIPRYMHIDYGPKLNGTGISMCHVSGFKHIKVWDSDVETEIKVPFITFDFLGKVFAPNGGSVDLPDIRELIIYELSRRGFYLKLISFDGYNSLESISILVNDGYACDRLSIDRTQSKLIVDYTKPNKVDRISTNGAFLAAWDALREAIVDLRIKMPYHSEFENEARHAERRIFGSKVIIQSPSATLSLDLLESMAGSIFNAINNERLVNFSEKDITSDIDKKAASFYKMLGRDESYREDIEIYNETDRFYDSVSLNNTFRGVKNGEPF